MKRRNHIRENGMRADREPRPGLGRPPKNGGHCGVRDHRLPGQYSVTFTSVRQDLITNLCWMTSIL